MILYLENVGVSGAEFLNLEAVLQLCVPTHNTSSQVKGILHKKLHTDTVYMVKHFPILK
jgi:hypothetical protein